MNVVPRHLAVPHQKTGCCQRRQAASCDVGVLFIHTLGLFRPRKGFIISVCIINAFTVFFALSPFRITIFLPFSLCTCGFTGIFTFRFPVLFRCGYRGCRSCRHHCGSDSQILFCCHINCHLSLTVLFFVFMPLIIPLLKYFSIYKTGGMIKNLSLRLF